MASENDNFGLSGPTHLTVVDWNNSEHRRSVAACLVQGAYVFEQDRRAGRQGLGIALASSWWEAFNFKLSHVLVDEHDQSSFGAIYDYIPPYPNTYPYPYPQMPMQAGGLRPPQHVIVFRGSINKSSASRAEDLKTNMSCMLSNLQDTRRFQIALENVSRVVSMAGGPGNVWLAGHSLGSSLALLVARHMAKSYSAHFESYLFNPPFASLPFKNEKLKTGLRFANSVVTAGLAMAAAAKKNHGSKSQGADAFSTLSSWTPYLFLNQSDTVCSEYIGYFEHREKMESIGAGKIGKLATKHSIGSIVSSAAKGKDSDPAHLIPSAYLTINCSQCRNFREAHGIHQWWKLDLELKYKLYQFK